MEGKSREAFEQEMQSKGWDVKKGASGDYVYERVHLMWASWQDSRAALVVELPPVSDVESDDTDVGYNICHRSVQEGLTNQELAFHVQGSERWVTFKGEGDGH